jgi:hypothetical protein
MGLSHCVWQRTNRNWPTGTDLNTSSRLWLQAATTGEQRSAAVADGVWYSTYFCTATPVKGTEPGGSKPPNGTATETGWSVLSSVSSPCAKETHPWATGSHITATNIASSSFDRLVNATRAKTDKFSVVPYALPSFALVFHTRSPVTGVTPVTRSPVTTPILTLSLAKANAAAGITKVVALYVWTILASQRDLGSSWQLSMKLPRAAA